MWKQLHQTDFFLSTSGLRFSSIFNFIEWNRIEFSVFSWILCAPHLHPKELIDTNEIWSRFPCFPLCSLHLLRLRLLSFLNQIIGRQQNCICVVKDENTVLARWAVSEQHLRYVYDYYERTRIRKKTKSQFRYDETCESLVMIEKSVGTTYFAHWIDENRSITIDFAILLLMSCINWNLFKSFDFPTPILRATLCQMLHKIVVLDYFAFAFLFRE